MIVKYVTNDLTVFIHRHEKLDMISMFFLYGGEPANRFALKISSEVILF